MNAEFIMLLALLMEGQANILRPDKAELEENLFWRFVEDFWLKGRLETISAERNETLSFIGRIIELDDAAIERITTKFNHVSTVIAAMSPEEKKEYVATMTEAYGEPLQGPEF